MFSTGGPGSVGPVARVGTSRLERWSRGMEGDKRPTLVVGLVVVVLVDFFLEIAVSAVIAVSAIIIYFFRSKIVIRVDALRR